VRTPTPRAAMASGTRRGWTLCTGASGGGGDDPPFDARPRLPCRGGRARPPPTPGRGPAGGRRRPALGPAHGADGPRLGLVGQGSGDRSDRRHRRSAAPSPRRAVDAGAGDDRAARRLALVGAAEGRVRPRAPGARRHRRHGARGDPRRRVIPVRARGDRGGRRRRGRAAPPTPAPAARRPGGADRPVARVPRRPLPLGRAGGPRAGDRDRRGHGRRRGVLSGPLGRMAR